MNQRALVLAVGCTLLGAAAAHPEGVAIDHRAVGCVVAGKFPRLNACFAPSGQLARARVYFRIADGPAEWYYVEMKSDSPCFAGVLPKPKKQLVGRRLQYYVNALDRGFAEARTDETDVRIVAKASDCDSKALVAPLLNSAAVAVFPGVPAGFAGAAGLGLGTTAAIVGGGAALAGGGVAVASSNSSSGSSGASGAGGPTTTTTAPPSTFPPTTTTTTTTTTTLPLFSPSFKVLKAGVPVASPISGTEPLVLDFDMCGSIGPAPLKFDIEVDLVKVVTTCRSTITFTAAGAKASNAGPPMRGSVTSRTFDVRMHVKSANPEVAGHRLTVDVTAAPPNACSTDTVGPSVQLSPRFPAPGAVYPSTAPYPVHMEAQADDTKTGNNGVSFVEYKVNYPGPTQAILGPVTGAPWAFDWSQTQVESWLAAIPSCQADASIQAYAVDGCGNATYSQPVGITLISVAPRCQLAFRARGGEPTRTWLSELAVAGGSGQVVVNGEAVFPRAGTSPISVRLQPGENRVEATLVEARSGGSWRFDLAGLAGLRAESLRVVAGDVVRAGADGLVFRLQGRPGERVVFSFELGE